MNDDLEVVLDIPYGCLDGGYYNRDNSDDAYERFMFTILDNLKENTNLVKEKNNTKQQIKTIVPYKSMNTIYSQPPDQGTYGTIKYRIDNDKYSIVSNFEKRGWMRTTGNDWNVYWASVGVVKSFFSINSSMRLGENQIINHFPCSELTRKDLMIKNFKRYKREMEKLQLPLLKKDPNTGLSLLDFTPITYLLPMELNNFMDDFKNNMEGSDKNDYMSDQQNTGISSNNILTTPANNQNETQNSYLITKPYINQITMKLFPKMVIESQFATPSESLIMIMKKHTRSIPADSPKNIWILKPCARSQGKGIVILHKQAQLNKWLQSKKMNPQLVHQSQSVRVNQIYLASKYIYNPLLIGGKKFDLRIYVLVVSYRPLKCYIYQHAFARFCTVDYSYDSKNISSPFIHLTNVAVQKHATEYDSNHGGKWHIKNLRNYISSIWGNESASRLFEHMEFLIVQSLKAVQSVYTFTRNCFECYGYDLIIDSNLRPWILEVNASPSLTCSTDADRLMKCKLLNDIFKVVLPRGFPEAHIKGTINEQLWANGCGLYVKMNEYEEFINNNGITQNGFNTKDPNSNDQLNENDINEIFGININENETNEWSQIGPFMGSDKRMSRIILSENSLKGNGKPQNLNSYALNINRFNPMQYFYTDTPSSKLQDTPQIFNRRPVAVTNDENIGDFVVLLDEFKNPNAAYLGWNL